MRGYEATSDSGAKLHISVPAGIFQMVALKCPDQELEATVERWQEWDLGETRHEVIAFINIYKHLNKSSW